MMKKYKNGFLIVEAIQWTGNNFEEIYTFCPSLTDIGSAPDAWNLLIPTKSKEVIAHTSDYIIKNECGDYEVYSERIFHFTYEPLVKEKKVKKCQKEN